MDSAADTSVSSPHVAETVASISGLRQQHEERGVKDQKGLRCLVAVVTRPGVLTLFVSLAMSWALINGIGEALGHNVVDPAPFFWLDTALAVMSISLTITILSVQRRDDELSALREQLYLELALLGEQKSAKIIQLLEELRSDLPFVPDRHDEEASYMARPSDPTEVMDAIEQSQ